MKILNRFLLSLVCLIVALVLPMFQVQAAEDTITTDQSQSVSKSFCSVYSFAGYEYGKISRTVTAEGLRVYSFGWHEVHNNSFSVQFVTYAFSSSCDIFMSSVPPGKPEITEKLKPQSVTIDGKTVYFVPLDGLLGGYDGDFSSFQYTDVPNLTMYSEQKDLSLIAQGIAEDMARAGYYDYDDSEWATDRPSYDSGKLQFSSSLGYLQGVQYKNVTPTDVFPYQIYSQISWDNSNDDFKNAYVQFAADMTYKVGAKIYSETMSIFNSYSIPYSDGKYTFLMSDVLSGSVVGSNATIKKVDNYYVRLVKYDRESSSFLYGGWTRINTNNFTIDTIAFDEENQDYYIDSDSDSSYSDQMGIDGNYGTTTWGDLSSASADSFKWFFSMLKDLFGMMGSFPSMLKTVFSFLPNTYINCLSLLLMACIIMRILGR